MSVFPLGPNAFAISAQSNSFPLVTQTRLLNNPSLPAKALPKTGKLTRPID
ncbi:MAG: hypothetical protein JXB24_04690 [Bacteroidales bacterium]|nr:hypothetical protein [Bacteroidales bacterium]